MPYPPPVHWREGMLLTAQHMQAFGRHLEGRSSEGWLIGLPHSWGIARYEIDLPALENYSFHLRNRFPELGRHSSVRAFWLACFGEMPLAEAMAWLDRDGVVIP